MTSPRARLATLVESAAFPLDKSDLLDLVGRAQDGELLDIVSCLADDHYVSRDELDHRLEDAMGMPGALPDQSALVEGTEWSGEGG